MEASDDTPAPRCVCRYRLVVWGTIAAVLLYGAAAWLIAGRLLTPANRIVGEPPIDLSIVADTIESESGSRLAVWFAASARENDRAVVVLLHPIRTDRRAMLDRARLLRTEGYAVVLVDLQAHGESPGERITVGHEERHDAEAAIAYAQRVRPGLPVGVVGCSLGGAAALLASPRGVDAMVLESVYPTIEQAVHNRVAMRLGPLSHLVAPTLLWQMPVRAGISPSDLRPIDHIAQVGCPVLVAGGAEDRHTTLGETRRLYERAKQPKELVVFDGAGHVDLLKHNHTQYKAEVLRFFHKHLKAD